MDTSLSPDAAGLPAPAAWRRVAGRTAGICGAALAAQLPAALLVGWPMAPADIAVLTGNQLVDFGCVGCVVALTLHAVERAAHSPRRWSARWRHVLLVAGLAVAAATQFKPVTAREFNSPASDARLEQAGLNTDAHRLRLYQFWFSAILAAVSAIYLLQRQESIEAEQRRHLLEAEWQQARRRMRIMRDAAGAARLDPQVLFDCLGLARTEYLHEAGAADTLLERLIGFLRGTLSGTRSAKHTLGHEIDLALLFAAIVAGDGEAKIVAAVAPALRRLEVCPGLLLPLVQQWLAACRTAQPLSVTEQRPLSVAATIGEAEPRRLCLHLSGPDVALDAALADCRSRLTDLYGSPAGLRSTVSRGGEPRLDIRFELPLDLAHVA